MFYVFISLPSLCLFLYASERLQFDRANQATELRQWRARRRLGQVPLVPLRCRIRAAQVRT